MYIWFQKVYKALHLHDCEDKQDPEGPFEIQNSSVPLFLSFSFLSFLCVCVCGKSL